MICKGRPIGKKNPLLAEHFDDFLTQLALDPSDLSRESMRSWWVNIADVKATNPNAGDRTDKRTPAELMVISQQVRSTARILNRNIFLKNLDTSRLPVVQYITSGTELGAALPSTLMPDLGSCLKAAKAHRHADRPSASK